MAVYKKLHLIFGHVTGWNVCCHAARRGMQALIGSLGLIEAERFLIAVNQDKFDYTEWRRSGLPDMSIEQIAVAANQFSSQLKQS